MTGRKAKGMKRSSRRLSEDERAAAWEFVLSVQGQPCVVCGLLTGRMVPHHVIEAQYLRSHHPEHVYDERNAASICKDWGIVGHHYIQRTCHGDHTSAKRRIPLTALRDENYAFAYELLGPAAYDYLKRRYENDGDPRLDALLEERETDAA